MENSKNSPKLKSQDEIRLEVIKEYELDANEEANQKFIDKLTSERVENQKKISTAINQKIKVRDGKDFYKKVLEDAKLDPKTGKTLEVKKDEGQFVTKEEFEKDRLRRQYSNLPDDEFDFINAQSKGSGKSFKDVLESPIVKTYLETNEAKTRIKGATSSPSTRFKPSGKEEDKIADELDRDLPVGFSSKKSN
jgi:hypothetical protein